MSYNRLESSHRFHCLDYTKLGEGHQKAGITGSYPIFKNCNINVIIIAEERKSYKKSGEKESLTIDGNKE